MLVRLSALAIVLAALHPFASWQLAPHVDDAARIGGADAAAFAVASIRPSSAQMLGYRLRTYPGRIVITGITAKELVEYAYDLEPFQVQGGPSWSTQDRFDLAAVTDDSTAAAESRNENTDETTARIRQMTQHLLATRFGLVMHTEAKPGAVYTLSLVQPMTDRNHPGLRPHIPDSRAKPGGSGAAGAYNVDMTNVPLSALARRLSEYLHCPVVDRTALSGTFDVDLVWYDLGDSAPADAEDLATSLKARLDLQLERTKAQIEVLVVDKIDHSSAN